MHGSAIPATRSGALGTDPAPRDDRPDIDIRVVLFSVGDDCLRVALTVRGREHSLPRGVPQGSSNLDAEARRVLRDVTGYIDQYIEQLYTLSSGDRDRWTVIVSYLALVVDDGRLLPDDDCAWFPVDALPVLGEADRMVLDYALLRLRAKIGYSAVAFRLLPPLFTLREVQDVYEAILGRTLDKRNFRRRVTAVAPIEPTGDKRRDGSHRPAVLFRFRGDHDRETLLTPPWAPHSETGP